MCIKCERFEITYVINQNKLASNLSFMRVEPITPVFVSIIN